MGLEEIVVKNDDVNRIIQQMTTNKMRERTRQLAEQAGFVLWDRAERRYRKKQIAIDWSCNYDNELEKFAELIVKECASIVLREDHEPDECILRHFGVKR